MKHASQAIEIPAQRRTVREQEMGHEDRLCAAEMRVRRHQRITRPPGQRDELPDRLRDGALDVRHAALEIQSEIDGHLLVPRASGMQPPPRVADARDELTLDEGMDIFV